MTILKAVPLVLAPLIATFAVTAQPTATSPLASPANGPRSAEPTTHILQNATLHISPTQSIDNGTVVIVDGIINAAFDATTARFRPPPGAQVHDLTGNHVYAGFIDPYLAVDAPELDAARPGAHWNDKVTPDRVLVHQSVFPAADASARRRLGYTAAALAPDAGVFAGQGTVVSLASAPADRSAHFVRTYLDAAFHTLQFETGSWTNPGYPTSHPGAVALMRQTLSDADWQRNNPGLADHPSAIAPLEDATALPLLFNCDRELELLLAADIAQEANRDALLVGNGSEYKWLHAIADTDLPVIIPLRYPRKPDVSTPARANEVDLEALMQWELAPANAAMLTGAGVEIAITPSKLTRGAKFYDHLREAIDRGLTEQDALAALTTVPAKLLGVQDQLGTIEDGKRANLTVMSAPFTDKDAKVLDVWIDGVNYTITDRPGPTLDGQWDLRVGTARNPAFTTTITVKGTAPEAGRPSIEFPDPNPEPTTEEATEEANEVGAEAADADKQPEGPKPLKARRVTVDNHNITFLIDDIGEPGTTILSGALQADGTIRGAATLPAGDTVAWTASPLQAQPTPDDDADSEAADASSEESDTSDTDTPPSHPGYPFGPYARAERPTQDTVLITNATVWTLTDRGTIDNGWVLIADGQIQRVGSGNPPSIPSNATRIDAKGHHVTPGLIDAHSHTSLFGFGVNEAGQAVTAEVRIADSLDPSSINWYRQLAGGVTTVLSLHGSANPIGGQSQTTKVRWGARSPEEMHFEDATLGIKFALGENVKRSNFGSGNSTRYPASRMGVETLIRDRFTAARDYMNTQDRLGSQARTDLELEAIAEILRGERLIHCHSYRQDEILMLCRVAEDFGLKIGTFQHGLEVYKVAEAVREHAIGASIFSDWWMFKVEVIDAIPYAGPLQTEAGVLSSFNSDSDELSRRMNLEAAKAVKYARINDNGEPVISQEEALKFVTLNPAIQLGIDDKVGSLEPGKHADVVIWTHNPLSTRAVPTHVFIDGREYFSLQQDAAHRERIASERKRLIQEILESPNRDRDNAPDDQPETIDDKLLADYYAYLLETGKDPEVARPGECGCGVIEHRIHYLLNQAGYFGAADSHAGHDHANHDHAGHNHAGHDH